MTRVLSVAVAWCLAATIASAQSVAAPTPAPLPTIPSFRLSPPPSPSATASTQPVLSPDQMQAIDKIAQTELNSQAVAGLTLAVVRNGRLVYSRGYGYSSIELQQTMNDSSLFEIGSITKQFTAAAVLALIEDGKLALDEPLSRFVPDYTNAKDVTLRQLLTMTSGIPDYTDVPGFDKSTQSPTTPSAIVATVKSQPLDFAPGTQWEYSNTNYVLLGIVIEKVTGVSYAQFLEDRILRPSVMIATAYGNAAASSPQLATGYAFDGQRIKPDVPWNLDWGYSTGGLVSNVLDLAVWDTGLLSAKAITLGSLREMWMPVTLRDGSKVPYGFGWSIGTLDGHRIIEDNGGLPGYNGTNATFPNDNFDVVVLANAQSFDGGPIVRKIFEYFFPPTKDQLAAQSAGDDVALARARDVFHRLQTGTLDQSQMTAEAAKRLTSDITSKAKASLSRLGNPAHFTQTDKYVFGTETVYGYRIEFRAGAIAFTLALDANQKVGELSVQPL